MKLITKTQRGPYGPHYAKKLFWYNNEWHFLKWVSKKELTNEHKTQKITQTKI